MSIGKFVCVYLIIINLITFILFGLDKAKAILHKWRIPEKTLILFSFFGGILGALFAMIFFNHKLKDKAFLSYFILTMLVWLIGIIVFLTLNP